MTKLTVITEKRHLRLNKQDNFKKLTILANTAKSDKLLKKKSKSD